MWQSVAVLNFSQSLGVIFICFGTARIFLISSSSHSMSSRKLLKAFFPCTPLPLPLLRHSLPPCTHTHTLLDALSFPRSLPVPGSLPPPVIALHLFSYCLQVSVYYVRHFHLLVVVLEADVVFTLFWHLYSHWPAINAVAIFLVVLKNFFCCETC